MTLAAILLLIASPADGGASTAPALPACCYETINLQARCCVEQVRCIAPPHCRLYASLTMTSRCCVQTAHALQTAVEISAERDLLATVSSLQERVAALHTLLFRLQGDSHASPKLCQQSVMTDAVGAGQSTAAAGTSEIARVPLKIIHGRTGSAAREKGGQAT